MVKYFANEALNDVNELYAQETAIQSEREQHVARIEELDKRLTKLNLRKTTILSRAAQYIK